MNKNFYSVEIVTNNEDAYHNKLPLWVDCSTIMTFSPYQHKNAKQAAVNFALALDKICVRVFVVCQSNGKKNYERRWEVK